MAAVNGETKEDRDATEQDESLTLGWRELYEDLQVHEYYPVDTFLVSVRFYTNKLPIRILEK